MLVVGVDADGADDEEQEGFITTSHTPLTGTIHLRRDIASSPDQITHQAFNSGGFEKSRTVEHMRTSERVTLDYGCDWRSSVQVWDESVC